jgi:hypothetical protein
MTLRAPACSVHTNVNGFGVGTIANTARKSACATDTIYPQIQSALCLMRRL